jgi:hypothetical protein
MFGVGALPGSGIGASMHIGSMHWVHALSPCRPCRPKFEVRLEAIGNRSYSAFALLWGHH